MDRASEVSQCSEHWLTTMTCTVCERIPDYSPVYKCNLGHVICSRCYEKLSINGFPRCAKCNSISWKQSMVSPDFLKKLKAKPGIGRPRRYHIVNLVKNSWSNTVDTRDETVTVEKLFDLSTDQVQKLFKETAKSRIKPKKMSKSKSSELTKSMSDIFCVRFGTGDDDNMSDVTSFVPPSRASSLISLTSKKPISCPHSSCSKVVTISSFFQHFKHEHKDIPVFTIERSKELHLIHDVRVIEYNSTYCMAIIKAYERYDETRTYSPKITRIANKFNQKVPIGTFWLLVSGSAHVKKSKSYVVYWLMTNTDERFSCTLELSSADENFTTSTFCSVNALSDSHVVAEIANRLNCLYLCYSSMCNLLEDGPKLHLRITLH